MFKKLTLAAGFGAGYVLGAKAGRERYTQLEAKFREFAGMPAVQNATASVKETASSVAESAKSTVNEQVEKVSDKTSGSSSEPSIDLSGTATTGTATTGIRTTGTTPMAGASASRTAPDITRP